MIKMKLLTRDVGLYLTGGLGNQLFQLAAALEVSKGGRLKIYEYLGKPRLNVRGSAEIFSLNIESIATIVRSDLNNSLVSKSSGYLLRSGIWPKGVERLPGFHFLAKWAATFLNVLISRNLQLPLTVSNVGYGELKFNKFLTTFFEPYLIGYFQTFFWPNLVKEKLKGLDLVEVGEDFAFLEELAATNPPIVVHIRRGDYTNENTFGLPGITYYKDALKLIDEQYSRHPIWVFSDDELEARRILSWVPKDRVTYISDVDGSSAASWMAMRLGCAYAIANSTFSWWGAFLSRTQMPMVIAPEPWFIGQEDPKRLIPPGWIRLKY